MAGGNATIDKLRLILRIAALARRNRWSRPRLAAHRARVLASLRRFAIERSPFYGQFHRGLENMPLAALPVLTKDRLMESFSDVPTVRGIRLDAVQSFVETMSVSDLFAGRYHVITTSGTTGHRGIFLYSKDEWRTLAMASVARGLAWSGGSARGGGRGVVMTSTIPWHMTARASAELRRLGLGAGRLALDAGTPMGEIVAQLNRYDPTSMVVYPSLMQILAGEQLAGRLRISPSHILCTSEVLTADARDAIREAFGVGPANLYAASECGCLAASCERKDGLHIAEDLVILESVDERNRPVPDGESGTKILLTVLPTRTMPLIRYEMSDRVVLDPEACACGKPYARIRDIAGRQGDILRLPAASGAEVETAPAQITAALRGTGVKQWQLSLEPDELVLRCVCDEGSFDAAIVVARLTALLSERGARIPCITALRVDAIERGLTGKTRAITTLTR